MIGAFILRGLDWKALLVIGLLVAAAIVIPLGAIFAFGGRLRR